MTNNGTYNEHSIIYNLNGKTLNDIQSKFLQNAVKTMFPEITPFDIIKCKKVYGQQKADIAVTACCRTVYISIKSGESNSVHQENIYDFCKFLLSLGIEKRPIKILLFFQFGDGSLNGTGLYKWNAKYMEYHYKKLIKEFNEAVNKPEILRQVYERLLFQNSKDTAKVNYILYGNVNYGFLISREKVIKYLLSEPRKYYIAPHFGPIVIQAYNRHSRVRRQKMAMQAKWHGLEKDIRKMN